MGLVQEGTMSLALPARRRGPARVRRGAPPALVGGSEHVAGPGRRVYVVAYHRSAEDAREARGGEVTTFHDHDSAPERVVLVAPGPGPWFVSVLERGEGQDGFDFAVGLDTVPLLPR
jgi:hypothetical protein